MTTTEKDDLLWQRVQKMTPTERQRLIALATPRIVDDYFVHIPHPKQQLFLSIQTREALYGGAAGGGKSDALLMGASQYVDIPGYSALILRRTWPDLNSPGAILDRAKMWWSTKDVKIREGGRIFIFPSGARIQFGYVQHEKDKYKFQSAEYQYIGFDELTQFSESIYTYLFSRLRRPQVSCLNCAQACVYVGGKWKHGANPLKCRMLWPDPMVVDQYPPNQEGGLSVFDIPLRMRSATNPGGYGHEWVKSRFIEPKTRLRSSLFVPASLKDNPSLDQKSYRESLSHLLPAERERLMNGDWDVFEQGDFFQREWFDVRHVAPTDGRVVRYWDRAATQGGGDFTVGTRLRLSVSGTWYVEDVVRGQFSPEGNEKIIAQTAAIDGRRVMIAMEQEPGSSGKDVIDHYRRNVLVGYAFYGIRSTGSKGERAVPASTAAQAGNIVLLPGQWNKPWLDELALFPNGANDDQVDSLTGGFNFLANVRRGRVIV